MKIDSIVGGPKVNQRFNTSNSTKFSIDEAEMGLVMSYMTKLYDDPVMAMVREVICNAFDAHTAAGQTDPVHISYPSEKNRYFEVTDTGTGMDYETIQTIYTKYGKSTKRNSDSVIGGYGLGCKAPLASEDEFILESTCDGMTTAARIFKNERHEFELSAFPAYHSGKPNGTTVRINLKKTSYLTVRSKIMDFLRYVPQNLYVLTDPDSNNPVEAPYILDNTEEFELVTDHDGIKIYRKKRSRYNINPVIVMGNVSYQANVPKNFDARGVSRYALDVVIVAPINSVDITPSRENVQETDRTSRFILKAMEMYAVDLRSGFQERIDAATDPQGVYEALSGSYPIFDNGGNFTYKGNSIVRQIPLEKETFKIYRSSGISAQKNVTKMVEVKGDNAFIVLPDETPKEKDGSVTRALLAYLSHVDVSGGTFYFLDPEEPAITSWWATRNTNVRFITRGEILEGAKAYRSEQRKNRPRTESPRKSEKTKYSIVYNDLESNRLTIVDEPYDEIDKGILYISPEELYNLRVGPGGNYWVRNIAQDLKVLLDTFEVTAPVLVLDGNKKTETMVKRVKGRKLDLSLKFLEQSYAEDFKYDTLIRSSTDPYFGFRRFVTEVGGNLDKLKDERFAKLNSSTATRMPHERYHLIDGILRRGFPYDADRREEADRIRDEWIPETPEETINIREETRKLMKEYENLVDMNYSLSNGEALVTVFNALYENHLTK